MPSVATEIVPKLTSNDKDGVAINDPAPGFVKRRKQSPEETVHTLITDNGYRITIITSLSNSFNEQGFIGSLHQALLDISENDPRALQKDRQEELLFAPRQFDMTGAYFDQYSDQVPKRYFLAIHKITNENLNRPDLKTEVTPSDETGRARLENGIGRFIPAFSDICPDYYLENGRGPFIQQNMRGFPVRDKQDRLHIVESPYLKTSAEGLPGGYGPSEIYSDMLKNLGNAIEALGPGEAITGCSVMAQSKVATIGQREINSIDFFLQSKRKDENGNPKPYTTAECTDPLFRDAKGELRYVPSIRKNEATGELFDCGLYKIEVSDEYGEEVEKFQQKVAAGQFGFLTHELTGSGNTYEMVQMPQYCGEPAEVDVGIVDQYSKRLTSCQQNSNYLMVMANGLMMAPSNAILAATNPQTHEGKHFITQDYNVASRWSLFRYKVKDTEEIKNEMALKAQIYGLTGDPENPDWSYWVSFHNQRSRAGMHAVFSAVTGQVLIDINVARLHQLETDDFVPASYFGPNVAFMVADILKYFMDEGTVFQQQRVVSSSMDAGGFPLYDEKQAYLFRNWIGVDGICANVQKGIIPKFMRQVYEMNGGPDSNATILAQRSVTATPKENFFEYQKLMAMEGCSAEPTNADLEYMWDMLPERYKKQYDKLPDRNGFTYKMEDQWVEGLNRFVAQWDLNETEYEDQASAAVYNAQAKVVNKPIFYGRPLKLTWEDGTAILDENGQEIWRPEFAVSYFVYRSEEDYARSGVAIRREFRMFGANMRDVMYQYGYTVAREEGKHDWSERATRAPIDGQNKFDENGEIVFTDRGEVTFYFESFVMWKLDLPALRKLLNNQGKAPKGASITSVSSEEIRLLREANERDARKLLVTQGIDESLKDLKSNIWDYPLIYSYLQLSRNQDYTIEQILELLEEKRSILDNDIPAIKSECIPHGKRIGEIISAINFVTDDIKIRNRAEGIVELRLQTAMSSKDKELDDKFRLYALGARDKKLLSLKDRVWETSEILALIGASTSLTLEPLVLLERLKNFRDHLEQNIPREIAGAMVIGEQLAKFAAAIEYLHTHTPQTSTSPSQVTSTNTDKIPQGKVIDSEEMRNRYEQEQSRLRINPLSTSQALDVLELSGQTIITVGFAQEQANRLRGQDPVRDAQIWFALNHLATQGLLK